MGMGGTFREIVPPERIVHTELLDQEWTGGETVVTTVFEEMDGRTTAMATVRCSSQAAFWTHVRRDFHDERLANASPLAREAIERMRPLFAVEAEIRGQPPEARSAPLMADLHAWLEATLRRISGKSDLAKVIRYTLAQWTALTTVLRDGRACLHNNAAERPMRHSRWGGGTA